MKKNRTIKRLLAFLLCAAMMITYMPSSVYTFADETGGDAVAVQEEPVAEAPEADEPAEDSVPAVEEPAPEAEDPVAEKPAGADKPSDDAGTADEQAAEPERDAESPEPEGNAESPEPEGAVESPDPEKAAEEPDKEEAYPAHHFTGKADGVDVEVDAPEGSLPEGTTMKVSGVGLIQMAQVKSAVKEEMGKNTSVVKAVDITFYDAEGNEVQPKEEHPVSVSLKSRKFAELENPGVVHIDDKKNA